MSNKIGGSSVVDIASWVAPSCATTSCRYQTHKVALLTLQIDFTLRLDSSMCMCLFQVVDAVARFMAIISSGSQPAVMHIAKGPGVSLLLHLLRAISSSSTALGNACLCIGELAKHRELLPALSSQDAVAPLLGMTVMQPDSPLLSRGVHCLLYQSRTVWNMLGRVSLKTL